MPPTMPPTMPPSTCNDTDNGKKDSYGDTCADYYAYPSWCGGYDDSDFTSGAMCCACGGGTSGGAGTMAPTMPPTSPPPGSSMPPSTCSDTDNGKKDSYGDTCADYYAYPSWCGGYDDNDFTSGGIDDPGGGEVGGIVGAMVPAPPEVPPPQAQH